MSVNIRSFGTALSFRKQVDLATAQTVGNMWGLSDASASPAQHILNTEDNANDIGKSDAFPTQNFLTSWDLSKTLDKYTASQILAWAAAAAIGTPTISSPDTGAYQYVITPFDESASIDLPSFTYVEKIAGYDRLYKGVVCDQFGINFSSGPGRANSKVTIGLIGTGAYTEPSGITIPAALQESSLSQGSAAVTINGMNYITGGALDSLTWQWNNNLRRDSGYFIGSGVQAGAQIRGRMEMGDRTCTMSFRVRLESGSTEFTKLINQTEGTAAFSLTGALIAGATNHSFAVSHPRIVYSAAQIADANGLAVVEVTVKPMKHASNGFLSVTAITNVNLIGT